MLMKLAIERDRFRGFLSAVERQAKFHQEHVPAALERMADAESVPERLYTDAELRKAVGRRVYAELRNYFADIEIALELGLETVRKTGEELRKILVDDLPGQKIVEFQAAEAMSGLQISPSMQARTRAALRDGPGPTA
jgi:hypothetical protein